MRVSAIERDVIYKRLGIRFFPEQERVCHDVEHTFLIFAGGVGAGKSMTAALYMLPEVLVHENGVYWIVADNFSLARMEFDWLVRFLRELGVQFNAGPNMPQEGEWYFELTNGCKVLTKSATRPDGLHAVPVDGMIAAEAGLLDEWLVVNRLMPRVLRARGQEPGWILFDGTFEGSQTWFAEKYWKAEADPLGEWGVYSMPSWENTIDFPGGRTDPKIVLAEKNMTPEEFMQRFGAVPMTPAGVVLKEWQSLRHVTEEAEYNQSYPVQIWVDPGRTYAVAAVQIYNNIVHQFDEIYLLDGTTERAIEEATKRAWWPAVRGGWIDIAAREAAETWATGAIWEKLSRQRQEKLHGIILQTVAVDIVPGIERVRTMLHSKVYAPEEEARAWEFAGQKGVSRILVHPRCTWTIKETQLYCYPRDAVIWGQKPVDRHNHIIKAWVYGCVGNFGYSQPWQYRQVGQLQRAVIARLA